MADSQFAAIFPILANRVGELRNLSMSARNYQRIAPFGSKLTMQLRHNLASVEDGYFANSSERFPLCEPFLRGMPQGRYGLAIGRVRLPLYFSEGNSLQAGLPFQDTQSIRGLDTGN